jgi:cell division protein FtsW
MSQKHKGIDKVFLIIVFILVSAGFLIFSSASLGLLARDGVSFTSIALGQIILGIFGGSIALIFTAQYNYRNYRKYAPYLFLFSILVTLLVFIPQLGFSAGGATRWIDLGITTFQPAELLKLGFVIYLAAWLSSKNKKLHLWKHGLFPFTGIMAIVTTILLLQPDTGTSLVIFATGTAMFMVAGGRIKDIILLLGVSIITVLSLAATRPYIKERLVTFLDPSSDPLGNGYQIQQSLIAIGSGNWSGRGFGQSVQKFDYLPEPIGDSIFAVFAEEFGFIGVILLLTLFIVFFMRGLRIASNAPDQFGGLLVVGIVILIVSQSFINIGSMIGLFPLTGLPLLFVSHGGSALLFALIGVGIVLNVSRHSKIN